MWPSPIGKTFLPDLWFRLFSVGKFGEGKRIMPTLDSYFFNFGIDKLFAFFCFHTDNVWLFKVTALKNLPVSLLNLKYELKQKIVV